MHIGVCKLKLRLPGLQSLKSKRQVLQSVLTGVKNNFSISVAEVDEQDLWQVATLGVSCVSNSAQQVNRLLSKVVDFISASRFDLEVLDYEIEIVNIL